MRANKLRAARHYSARDKLTAVAAALAVVVLTALAIFLMKPGDSEPDVTDLPPSVPEIPDTGAVPEQPPTTAPAGPTAPPPVPDSSTDPAPPPS